MLSIFSEKQKNASAMSSILLRMKLFFSFKQDLVSCVCFFVVVLIFHRDVLFVRTYKRIKKSFNKTKKKQKGFSTFCTGITFSFSVLCVIRCIESLLSSVVSHFVDLFQHARTRSTYLCKNEPACTPTKGSDH